MKVTTDWLPKPLAIGGLDHLGTQAPCILAYGQLIPGITNVTDRARYYSLYTWMIHAFDQRFPKAELSEFVSLFRRGDFLLTLIAERHARVRAEPDSWHGAAMAGRTQMTAAMSALDETGSLELETFSTTRNVPTRYFKSRLGGLSQYYVGTLAELGLLDPSSQEWVKYTNELGAPLAMAVNKTVPADLFWSVVVSGVVSPDELDALVEFCPCGLHPGSEEHALLLDMFFAEAEPYKADQQRRSSLGMLLHLAHGVSSDESRELDASAFRGAVYAGSLPASQLWRLPSELESTRALWGVYEKNDLLSVAFQGVFASALEQLAGDQASGGRRYSTVEELSVAISRGSLGSALVQAFGTKTFGGCVESLRDSAPPMGDWLNPEHEHELCTALLRQWRTGSAAPIRLTTAFQLLGLLVARDDPERAPYHGLAIAEEELRNYPINLATFRDRSRTWTLLSVREVLEDAIRWSLTTHLRVATRKLRQTGHSTFRFRPGELGLEISETTPLPARTTPRFNQTTRVLIDLGTLRHRSASNPNEIDVTPLGREIMDRYGQ